jgi:probable rRNA maturation factor
MKVIQVNQTAKHRASKDVKFIEQSISKIIKYLNSKRIRNRPLLAQKKELTVVFLTAVEMQKINSRFRKKNKPTDILSFSGVDEISIGELLLCSDVLKKQAKQHGHSFEAETFYMLIHGLLHLLGYDHEASKAEERLMFRIQDQCFKTLGPV